MLMTNCSLMSSKQPPLQKGNNPMDAWQQMLAFRLMTLHTAVMNVSIHSKIGRQPIGYDRTAGFNGKTDKPVQTCFGHIRNATKTDPPDSLTVLFSRYDNHGFFFSQAAHNTFFIAAPVCFVNLHYSPEPISARTNHGSSQFVQKCPTRFITTQTKYSLQPLRAHPVFLAGNVPHGTKPQSQRQMAILKNGACSNRNLIFASSALPKTATHWPSCSPLTTRADKTFWPTKNKQVFSACLFTRKSSLQFRKCTRKFLTHTSYTTDSMKLSQVDIPKS